MEANEAARLVTIIAVFTISTACIAATIGVAIYLWREIREVSQWLDDLEKQRKNPKPDDHDDDEYDPDDYDDIDPEADTVEFTPLPPDANPPKPRSTSN